MPMETGDANWNYGVNGITFSTYGQSIGAFIGSVGFFVSHDNGETWTKNNQGLPEITTGAPLSNTPNGFALAYGGKWYLFNGSSWSLMNFESFVFDIEYDEWRKYNYLKPNIRDFRQPYMVAVDGEYAMGYVYYTIDNGKKWFRFSETSVFTSAYATSVIIHGNYIYAGFVDGFARRSLSEAVNHTLKKKKEEPLPYPVSPEEMEELLNIFGADALEELLEEMGLDSDELSSEEMKDFLNDYLGEDSPSDIFGNTQPGSCSYMGMPVWGMNAANLKLFIRDVIFRKKGLGPEVKLAMNFVHSADSSLGIFGKHWKFEYENYLVQLDSAVMLTTGTGAVFTFSAKARVITGATPFSLPCLNNEKYTLHWTGSAWQVEKGIGYEYLHFIPKGGGVFILGSIEDSYGKRLSISYNAAFKPTKITDGSGRGFILNYSGGFCNSIQLPDGRSASFQYNARNMLISSIDLNGIESKYSYDPLRNITSANIAGKTTAFGYSHDIDSLGMIAAVIDPEGRITEYFSTLIDSATSLTNIIYQGNKTVTYQLHNGKVTSITNAEGEVKKIFYNQAGMPVSLVWYDGSSVTFTYDENGNIVSKNDSKGNLTTYEYTADRKLINEKDAGGEILFSNTYNSKNQIESITLPDGLKTTYTYNTSGSLATVKNGDQTHTLGWDEFGNLVSHTNPLGNTMNFFYSPEGLVPIGKRDFNGNDYVFTYDHNGRISEIIMPDGSKRIMNYDCCAQTGITDENGNTQSVTRDATNRVTEKITAEGVSLPVYYDESGFISGFMTVHGIKKNLKYNSNGLLSVVSDEDGYIKYGYNQSGQLVSVFDKKNNETKFAYNSQKELTEIIDAAGVKTTFSFNSGKLNSYTNARAQTAAFTYDQKGQVTEKSVNSNSYASYNYNLKGEIIGYTDSSGTTTYTRNAIGFVTKIRYPYGLSVDFEHDANGNITKITYPNGMVVNNTPDEVNRIVNLAWLSSSVDFTYDPAGNLLSETRSNTTNTIYNYNKDNLLTSVSHYVSDTVFAGETVMLENGIVKKAEIKTVPEISRIPRGLFNLASNNLNQIKGSLFDHVKFFYDKDGNLTVFEDNEMVKMSAIYAHDNLLASINTGSELVKLSYDAMRYPRKIVANGKVSYLYYDHKGRLLFETDGSGNLTRNYVYRGKRLIACQTVNNETYFYHYNRNGHTLAVTGSEGSLLNTYAYSGQGEIIGKEESRDNRFTFLGAFGALRLHDDYIQTGARVYSAQLGRYIQRDPLGIITGTNPYLYASNNPISGIDPLGLDEQQKTVNTQNLDPSSDNDYSTAGGTANPFANDGPGQNNDWEPYSNALKTTLEEFSNHPIADLLPDGIANPIGIYKAIDNLSNKEYGKAMWQFVPFNNSMEAAGNYIQEKTKYVDPTRFSGMGIFGEFNKQKTFSCDM